MSDKLINLLKKNGFRSTRVRRALLDIFEDNKSPLSVPDLKKLLKERSLKPNKTTIYREIYLLKEQDVIKEVNFGENKKRYELTLQEHHHHIICTSCSSVEDAILDNELATQERKIEKDKNFKINYHSLEFFGLCRNCQ